jgi:phospholipid/cholesterol/gamma-HCH transport system substrate-binding protein
MASNERAIEIKVGALIVICLLILVAFVVALGDYSLGETTTVLVDFDTSSGLKTGAPVKVSGIKAGHVHAIDFRGGEVDPDEGRPVFVRVSLHMNPDTAAVLREDASFYIAPLGLLGEKYVEIDPGRSSSALGDTIKLGLTPMRVEVMAKNLNTFLKHSAKLVSESETTITDTLKDIRATAKAGRELAEEGKALMTDVRKKVNSLSTRSESLLVSAQGALDEYTPGKGETGNAIKETMSRSAHLVSTLDKAAGDGTKLKSMLSDLVLVARTVRTVVTQLSGRAIKLASKVESIVGETDSFIKEGRAEFNTISGEVRKALRGVSELMENVRDGEGTIGALLHDREMYDDIREMMKDLKRHPWKFLWKE